MKTVRIYNEDDYAREMMNPEGKTLVVSAPLNFAVINELMNGKYKTLKNTIAQIDAEIKSNPPITIIKP